MFGWEFPPNISGGLGTACLGITKSLSAFPEIELTFVVPKTYGNEPVENIRLIGANEIDLIASKIKVERLCGPHTFLSIKSGILPYIDPEDYKKICKPIEKSETAETNRLLQSIEFTGKYHPDLMTEIYNFSVVAEYIAKQGNYDIIHAHDWLTFPAGILAKKVTGKPLLIHVHATDFDRGGGKANPAVFEIERAGMEAADGIIAVSNHTSKTIQDKYGISPSKLFTVHNGVEPFTFDIKPRTSLKKKIKTVTFLGRITTQKGPRFFIEVAQKILARMKNVEFVMAGDGDLLNTMKDCVLRLGISDKFHFPGFLIGKQVKELLTRSDVYIMPSISEPFGISPLEAMYLKVPVIISKQSGVSEVINHAIKLDFWDTEAIADTVYSILTRPAIRKMMIKEGAMEARKINWETSASKLVDIYKLFLAA